MFFIPIFITRFVEKFNFFKGKIVYQKHSLGTDVINAKQKELITKNRNLLSDNRVPLNKIRFVFQPTFTYDIDNDVINPKYDILLPVRGDDGLYDKNSPVIEIGKPKNIIMASVLTYETPDNYQLLKQILKHSKRGIVIFIADESVADFKTGELVDYKFSVDDERIRFTSLDDEVLKYNIEEA